MSMAYNDEWGSDPAVQMMRKVFGRMEHAYGSLLKALQLSPFDPRMRQWRERALVIFERTWAYAVRRGTDMSEEMASDLYIFALARVMGSGGVPIPEELVPISPDVLKLFQEALK
jgi:hypothetical protein